MKMKTSAGLLMYKVMDNKLYVFLVHPGGPFFARKDEGVWSVPKGELESDSEDKLKRATKELKEEAGLEPRGKLIDLGTVIQKNNKVVYAWGFEGDIPSNYKLESNTFEMEWPPNSSKKEKFPEVDRGEFLEANIARKKINPSQIEFIDRLEKILKEEKLLS